MNNSNHILNKEQIQIILKNLEFIPKKSLGQNFLVDNNALRRVVEAAEVSEGDTVLEIGAGLGSLTQYLAHLAQWVIAVEIDENLISPLGESLITFDNVEIICGDILDLDPKELFPDSDYLVIFSYNYHNYNYLEGLEWKIKGI